MAPIIVDEKKVRSFASEASFEAWLAKHHDREAYVWLRIYKKGSGVPSITTAQALDVVLCWGWIDGTRKGLDESSFLQRYSPRTKKSIWSQINREHVARLVAAGRMTPHGQRQVDLAKADGRWDAAYAPMRSVTEASVPADLRAAISKNAKASATFAKLGRPNLFALIFRMSRMKTPVGRERKIAELVALLARGETILPEGQKRPRPESTEPRSAARAVQPRATQAPPKKRAKSSRRA